MNILAIDDEFHALNLLEQAITEAVQDATVFVCRSVDSALLSTEKFNIDVAFMDIHMPGMNGLLLAAELKKKNPRINIIFVTGFSEYMKEGIDLRMSGYIFKPVTADAIKNEMENLRFPIEWNKNCRIRALTFGNFELFCDGVPVKFERKQSKEILAYLIDKRGTSVSYAELAAVLWEDSDYDRTQQKNLQVYIASLVKTLDSIGARDIIMKNRQGIAVNAGLIDCDYYRFLDGDQKAVNSFTGQYMNSYSWAEFTAGFLQERS